MNHSTVEPQYIVSTPDLQSALEVALSQHFRGPCRLVGLDRQAFWNRSSFALEELTVYLENGSTLPILFKDLSWPALSAAGRLAKPGFLYDPLREIETYRTILAPDVPDAPTCYGAVVEAQLGRYWLFLEKVPGLELYYVGFETWVKVAEWLASLHHRFAQEPELDHRAQAAHVLRYDATFYGLWPRRAQAFLRRAQPVLPAGDLARLDQLVDRYDAVVQQLLVLPLTLIHGECYASNVLVQEREDALRVCPVDWEMAAIGPGLMDIVALTAGSWTEEQKVAMALAYRAALAPGHGWPPAPEIFLKALNCCRLHVAMQWLGWSEEWSPPPEHAQNWLSEALHVAE
jgi:Ser/Thr protein kinase RdoA (MazF antagonist)